MLQSFGTLFSSDGRALQMLAVAAAALVFLAVVYGLYRLVFAHRLRAPGASRGRAPRLGVVDVFSLDGQRQLVIVRRDNVEHLLMVGGPNDIVVEPNINRNAANGAGREAAKALEPLLEPASVATPAPIPRPVAPQPISPLPRRAPPRPAAEAPAVEPAETRPARAEPTVIRAEPAPAKAEPAPVKTEPVAAKPETVKAEIAAPPPVAPAVRPEPVRAEPARLEPIRAEPPRVEPPAPKAEPVAVLPGNMAEIVEPRPEPAPRKTFALSRATLPRPTLPSPITPLRARATEVPPAAETPRSAQDAPAVVITPPPAAPVPPAPAPATKPRGRGDETFYDLESLEAEMARLLGRD